MAAHRAFPQRQGVELAAQFQRQAVAGGVQLHAMQVVGGRHEAARRLRARARHVDVEPDAAVLGGVEQPQLGTALVDDALAVAGGVAGVIVGVVGVAAQRAAVGRARIEVAGAFEVAQEIQALADPHRRRDVAPQLVQAAEDAAAGGVDPQVAGGAAAITLPARRVGGVAADHARPAGAEGEVVDLPQRQPFGQSAGGRDGPGVPVAEEGLAVVAAKDDAAIGRPAAHREFAAQPGQPSRRAAGGGHQPDLAVLLVAAGVGQPAAVARQARRGRLGQPGGEAQRGTAGGGHAPQVVVADEDDGVAVQRGLAQVGGGQGVGVHGGVRQVGGAGMIPRSPRPQGVDTPSLGRPTPLGWRRGGVQ